MRDAGESLGTRLTRHPDLAAVETLYREHAELQVASAAHVDELIGMGVRTAGPLCSDASSSTGADSCVGHPFFGVVVGLRSISDRLGLDPGAEPLEHPLPGT